MSKVSKEQIDSIIRHVKRDLRDATNVVRWVEASKRILQRFLGDPWIRQHLSPKTTGFFAGFDSPTFENMTGARRTIELANMLMNFQKYEGFDYPLGNIKTGNVEDEYASLEVAKMLFTSPTKFRFVVPIKVKGCDFDFEAYPLNGPAVPIEAKCKAISANFTENGILNILKNNTDQLPPNRPGVMVLRVPREWVGDDYLTTPFAKVAQTVLRNSSRVAGIIILSNQYFENEGLTASFHISKEFWSTRDEFKGAEAWNLFRSGFRDETSPWLHIRILMGNIPKLGITAAEANKRLGFAE